MPVPGAFQYAFQPSVQGTLVFSKEQAVTGHLSFVNLKQGE